MKKSLLVLAAGMGSRYGGLKQMDPIGPSGEFILDYSVHDALRAGFERIVFVVRRDIQDDFRAIVGSRWEGRAEVRYAVQRLNDLPAGFAVPEGRTKPWGTGHAVLAAREILDGPFAVVNADDFYGRSAFAAAAAELDRTADDPNAHALVAYGLASTLSENGSVSRGVCRFDASGHLVSIDEKTALRRDADGVIRCDGEAFADDTPVSMNLYAFKPSYLRALEEGFPKFLAARGGELKSEYYMAGLVSPLIASGAATFSVLRTDATWFGVTNAADRPAMVARFAAFAANGTYPRSLFAP